MTAYHLTDSAKNAKVDVATALKALKIIHGVDDAEQIRFITRKDAEPVKRFEIEILEDNILRDGKETTIGALIAYYDQHIKRFTIKKVPGTTNARAGIEFPITRTVGFAPLLSGVEMIVMLAFLANPRANVEHFRQEEADRINDYVLDHPSGGSINVRKAPEIIEDGYTRGLTVDDEMFIELLGKEPGRYHKRLRQQVLDVQAEIAADKAAAGENPKTGGRSPKEIIEKKEGRTDGEGPKPTGGRS